MRAIDRCSLSHVCSSYYVLTGGGHPFGRETHKREANIMEHDADLSELEGPEAVEAQALIASMISARPEARISALQVPPMCTLLAVANSHEARAGVPPSFFLGSAPSSDIYTLSIGFFGAVFALRAICCCCFQRLQQERARLPMSAAGSV